ncbi:MAG: hypothetical protein AB1659_11430, partial [Thermodesulfobacteriota bacterium]
MDHQPAIFEVMSQPKFYPHPVDHVDSRETHISKLFLTGAYVYKIKKPLNLGFLDFTTLENRKHFCHEEVSLNRRLSTGVYLEVTSVSFHDGRYFPDETGNVVEYAVKMKQLPEEDSMEMRLRGHRIGLKEIETLARKLSDFYDHAEAGDEIDSFGSWEVVNGNCEENFSQIQSHMPSLSGTDLFQIIRSTTRSFLQRRKELFNQRIRNGKIRDCHGDLRCDHIYFTDGIQIIDCIEFNTRFRFSDVTCDLAFLSMDLDFLGFPEISEALIRSYVQVSGDSDTYVLMDFYKCYRAMVRAKVNALRCTELDVDNRLHRITEKEAQKYLDIAYHCAIRFSRPTLWIVFGMPASGKSTVAKELSGILDIEVLRS